MKTNLIQELNDQKYLSCIKIQENDGVLNIYICGTVLCPLDLDSPECDQDVLTVLDENTREIRTDNRQLYQITFDRYISYQVLNESYSAWEKRKALRWAIYFVDIQNPIIWIISLRQHMRLNLQNRLLIMEFYA